MTIIEVAHTKLGGFSGKFHQHLNRLRAAAGFKCLQGIVKRGCADLSGRQKGEEKGERNNPSGGHRKFLVEKLCSKMTHLR
jgi:hypothetical protein